MSTELSTQVDMMEADKVSLPVGLSVFVVVLGLLVWGGVLSYQWLQDEQRLPVQNIVYSGQINMLDVEGLESLIRQQHAGSFFAIDVNDVHKLVEAQPWVYSASIRKRWPSSLYIHVVEQQAAARWNDDLLLNKYGESFDGKLANSALPVLFGPGGSEKTALTGYQHMRALLRSSGQKIQQLVLSERFAWTVQLQSGITLNLGRQEYIKRLQRFIDVYPLLKEEKKAINYVDLRYDTGLAVGWADAFPISQAETDNNTNN
ncbi:cell division protein FtsQ/DivIB [Glaciecola siphonariae]|uniref:Cell division protein FtsQ n=1 Tax=Glaciecola siphonariae TaxID=521012 RepID=A0ABV9LXC6_9ALTE